ncbi:Protein of unknown function [Evansella caseinilytica]|uniref:Sporulation inhibitor of replication protein SirA n=1 Tax=Evansella caseinilytica TaxID=1503961 RepID=A0A1H3LUS7_9BACI|nr:sporulation inhibitor of replication protein SirA [Evansella caseinilytica]SDY68110.1 Protein of unknown function [Evansella caseinilytica]
MREYNIYIIKDDVANDYYGLEAKLFQLFEENRRAKGYLKEVTDQQIRFIIKPVAIGSLDKFIRQQLQDVEGYSCMGNKHFIIMDEMNSQSGLYLDREHITLFSEGAYDAEACFFEVLRKFHPYFMAIDFVHKRYGWLRPIKSLEFVQYP